MSKSRFQITTTCANCLIEIQLYPSQIKERNYCSHACFYDLRRKEAEDPLDKWVIQVDKTPGQGPNGDCWIWTGSLNPTNYGVFCWPLKNHMGAHIASYILHTGDSNTKGFHICHSCDNPPCVNPAHLFKGTAQDNVIDAYSKKRRDCGEKANNAKLTNTQAVEIRLKRASGISAVSLAKEYGVAKATINRIIRGATFPNIPTVEGCGKIDSTCRGV